MTDVDAIDRAILNGLVSRLGVGSDHGISPVELAAPYASPARPEALVRERLEFLERAGLVWHDARGYRRS